MKSDKTRDRQKKRKRTWIDKQKSRHVCKLIEKSNNESNGAERRGCGKPAGDRTGEDK